MPPPASTRSHQTKGPLQRQEESPHRQKHPPRQCQHEEGRNEMDPPLCGSTTMSHNEFQISEPIKPQEASPMKQEMHVLGIDIAKRIFHAVGMDNSHPAPPHTAIEHIFSDGILAFQRP